MRRTLSRSVPFATAFVIGIFVVGLLGQGASDKIPSIEIASVKPNTTRSTRIHGAYSPSGLLTFTNYSVRTLIEWTFVPLPMSRISGGPAWINLDGDRFDIVARLDGPATVDQLRMLLRRLLIERFKLVTHTEKREGVVYELVRAHADGPLGTHLRLVSVDCSLDAQYRLPPPCAGAGIWPGLITGEAMTMNTLCILLMSAVDEQQVLDRTGLTGAFAVDLKFRPDQIPQPAPLDSPDFAKAVAAIDPNGPSLFTALEEQLGLKLEAKKAPIDFVVIDHVEKPTPD